MDRSPEQKKASFSDQLQVFENSEEGKQESEVEDSLLIDTDVNYKTRQDEISNVDQTALMGSQTDIQLQIDEISAGLA